MSRLSLLVVQLHDGRVVVGIFFFFQAEDGIRDDLVTGVQTCALPISIENVDAMGVHTGESITVAPAQTLTDVEYQRMRDAAFACIRRIGVETGGSNVQFSVDPRTGEQVIIEMTPRVSRSRAPATNATASPIAKLPAHPPLRHRLRPSPY